MARFKRRRSNGTWFPMLGIRRMVGEEEFYTLNLRSFDLTLPAAPTGPVVGVVPVTLDEPQESDEQSSDTKGLAEFIGNEYIIKRIVGQCFASRTVTAGTDGSDFDDTGGILVTAGFFVARAEDGESANTDSVPVGWDSADAAADYSPQLTQNIRHPWMWRRSWILGRGGLFAPAQTFPVGGGSDHSGNPYSNVFFGNMSDHRVDIKSRRRVRLDERLWFCGAAASIAGITTEASAIIRFDADLRIFGQLRKPQNHGSF